MKRSGFTLLELLVVIVIIGALAGIAAPNFMKQLSKPRDAERVTAVDSFAKMIKVAAANSFEINIYGYDEWDKDTSGTAVTDCTSAETSFECMTDDNDYVLPAVKKGYCYYYGYNNGTAAASDPKGTEFFVATALENTSKTTGSKVHVAGSTKGIAAAKGTTDLFDKISVDGSGQCPTVTTTAVTGYTMMNISDKSSTCGGFCGTP